MNNLIKIIKEELIIENLQLADKEYFNKGLLSKEDKEYILKITNGDHYTKIISDIYFYIKENYSVYKSLYGNFSLNDIYNELKNYNKNILPLKNLNIYKTPQKEINQLIQYLFYRKYIINFFKKIPSTAIRNIRNDIRLERNFTEFNLFVVLITELDEQIDKLNNRDDKIRNKILNKAFKSNNTISNIVDFFDNKENLLSSDKIKKEDIIKLVKNNSINSSIVFNKKHNLIIKISNPEDLKKIGCNSLWCFTYGNDNTKEFNKYAYNGFVYIIFDFYYETDEEGFSYTVIKPPKMFEDVESEYFDDEEDYDEQNTYMFNHFNDPVELFEADEILTNIFGNIESAYEILNFK